MSLSLEQLQTFQTKLESRSDVEETAEPVKGHVIEWALAEVVILLRKINHHLSKRRGRRNPRWNPPQHRAMSPIRPEA